MKLTLDLTKAQAAAVRRVFRAMRREQAFSHADNQQLDALLLQVIAAAGYNGVRQHTGHCHRCGCTDRAPCEPPCGWAAANLCTACLTPGERRRSGRVG